MIKMSLCEISHAPLGRGTHESVKMATNPIPFLTSPLNGEEEFFTLPSMKWPLRGQGEGEGGDGIEGISNEAGIPAYRQAGRRWMCSLASLTPHPCGRPDQVWNDKPDKT